MFSRGKELLLPYHARPASAHHFKTSILPEEFWIQDATALDGPW